MIAPTVVAFSPSCPSQPCAGLQFYLMSLHSSLV